MFVISCCRGERQKNKFDSPSFLESLEDGLDSRAILN